MILNKLLQNPIVVDTETTISNKGQVQDLKNKLCLIQLYIPKQDKKLFFTEENFKDVLPYLKTASCLIGFNFKFDLLWLKKVLNFTCNIPIYDVQLCEFLFSAQQWIFPSLEDVSTFYNIGHKIDKIKEYWDKGINTDEIPIEELIDYGLQDVVLTWEITKKQISLLKTTQKSKFLLFRLSCNDLLTLVEMEWNGLIFDEQKAIEEAHKYEALILNIDKELNSLLQPTIELNYASNDDISLILYGGSKSYQSKIPIGVYKTGLKIGQVRNKIITTIVDFPQLIKPLPKTELKKQGFYSTDEPTLLSLKPNVKTKKIITLLLNRSKYKKIIGTYLLGLPKLREKMNWPINKIYPNYNQCLTKTGRLSSSKPNAQNQPPKVKEFFISRYT